ncbi:AraC family transcriptional regulator [Enterococcus sp. HY326]|uniref:AraC family transcriptional regulator n=1 Tax=Enterococcus sp. HY326 TaxID=2971265 RepID=UPI00223F66F5|nr:GyrI-like domain-containing protein [Enterococcus sp. HY326]
MKYHVEILAPAKVAYLRNIGPYGSRENFELMTQFKTWIAENNLEQQVEKTGILAIARDNPAITAPENCRFDLLLKIREDFYPELPVQVADFAGGKYAVFEVSHTQEAIQEFWAQLPQIIEENHLQTKELPLIERYKAGISDKQPSEFLLPLV